MQEQLNCMVASHEAFVILVDFLDLNTTEKLIFFFLFRDEDLSRRELSRKEVVWRNET